MERPVPRMRDASDLPAEMILLIGRYCDNETKKTLRLVSKGFNSLVERELFSALNLKMNMRSFEAAQNISSSPGLSMHVRKLLYDTRIIPWGMDFEEYLECIRDEPGYMISVDKVASESHTNESFESLKREFGDAGIQNAFHRYEDFVDEQKDLHRRDEELKRLKEIVQTLPHLHDLELTSPTYCLKTAGIELDSRKLIEPLGRTWAEALSSLSYIAQACLIEPYFPYLAGRESDDGHHLTRRRVMLLRACAAADKSISSMNLGRLLHTDFITKLRISQALTVGVHSTHSPYPITQDVQAVLRGVDDLKIAVEDYPRWIMHSPDTAPLNCHEMMITFLGMFSQVRSLDLTITCWSLHAVGDARSRPIHKQILHHLYFRRLERLILSSKFRYCSGVGQDDLLKFLARHSETLRNVSINDISLLLPHQQKERCESKYTGDEERSWVRIFRFMSEDLRLEDVALSGSFTGDRNERWLVSDTPPIPGSAKTYVIRYLLQGGQSPFKWSTRQREATATSDSLDEDEVMDAGWELPIEDDSFRRDHSYVGGPLNESESGSDSDSDT